MENKHYVKENYGDFNIEEAEAPCEDSIKRIWVTFYKDPADPGFEMPYYTMEEAEHEIALWMKEFNADYSISIERYDDEEETW